MEDENYHFEDFLHMTLSSLQDYLALRGLSKSGNKAELVARAFGAYELKASIKYTQEKISEELKKEYQSRLQACNAPDPNTFPADKWEDNVLSWPDLDEGKVFSFILKNKTVETEYIGRYKDEKAYSFYESGFVGCLYSCCFPDQRNKVFIKCNVTPSTKVRDRPHDTWILFENNSILTTWCTCVAGTSLCCNHILAVLYKITFAHKQGYSNPACTSLPQGWNKGTHKQVEPKRICDLFIRNDSKLRSDRKSKTPINCLTKREFDPRHPEDRQLNNDCVSSFYQSIKACIPNACVLYSIDPCITAELPPTLKDAADNFLSLHNNHEKGTDELMQEFLEYIQLSRAQTDKVEEETRGQGCCNEWKQQRLGRITASIAHEVMTKTQSIINNRRRGHTPKYTPLVNKIVNGVDISSVDAVKWGISHEADALKQFMAAMTPHHDCELGCLKASGLLVKSDEPYLAASPDGLFKCRCCGVSVVEVKCPYSIRDQEIAEGYDKTDFLEMRDGSVKLKTSHKYFSQITMLMALAPAKQTYFVVWTTKGLLTDTIEFSAEHWNNLHLNATLFFGSYVLPVLLEKESYVAARNAIVLSLREMR